MRDELSNRKVFTRAAGIFGGTFLGAIALIAIVIGIGIALLIAVIQVGWFLSLMSPSRWGTDRHVHPMSHSQAARCVSTMNHSDFSRDKGPSPWHGSAVVVSRNDGRCVFFVEGASARAGDPSFLWQIRQSGVGSFESYDYHGKSLPDDGHTYQHLTVGPDHKTLIVGGPGK